MSYSPSTGGLEDAAAASAADVRAALLTGTEIALIDIRPEGSFAGGHPLFAASLPLGRLEAEVLDRLYRRNDPRRRPGRAAMTASWLALCLIRQR